MEPAADTIDAVSELPGSGVPIWRAARRAILLVCTP
jgi:hypothetical protein